MRAWILYSGVRLGLFAAIFALLYALTANALGNLSWAISAAVAAIAALCISYIFLKPLRDRVALSVAEARAGNVKVAPIKAGSDEDVEDSAADADAAD